MSHDAAHAEPDGNTSRGDLAPRLAPDHYVFCSLPGAQYGDLAQTHPLACVAEAEGLTLVLAQDQADGEGLAYTGLFRCISLGLHSSLDAVGLTAMISSELAQHGISANVIAGYHHDHVLVPSAQAQEALSLLQQLSTERRRTDALSRAKSNP